MPDSGTIQRGKNLYRYLMIAAVLTFIVFALYL